MGGGPVDRISEDHDEPDIGKNRVDPRRHERMKQIIRTCLKGLPMGERHNREWKVGSIPTNATVIMNREVMDLLAHGGSYIWMCRQVVEECSGACSLCS